jgi:hypothetical protein
MHIFGNPTTKHSLLPYNYNSLVLWVDAGISWITPDGFGGISNLINRVRSHKPNLGTANIIYNTTIFRGCLPGLDFTANGGEGLNFINPSITFGQNTTLIACCIPGTDADGNSIVMASGGSKSDFGINSSFQAYVGDNSSNSIVVSNGTVTSGKPCTVAAVVNSSTSTKLYINGILDISSGVGPSWAAFGANVIGGPIGFGNSLILAEFLNFNNLLTDQDIYLLHRYLAYKWF